MKDEELRAHATCSLCRKKIGVCGSFLFYRLTVERFGVKLDAVSRQAGLEMMLGGHVRLARAMGTDEDLAIPVMDPLVLVVCDGCSMPERLSVARLAEIESTIVNSRVQTSAGGGTHG